MVLTVVRCAGVVGVLVACAHPLESRPLPAGVVADCFLKPCRVTADLDGDGRPDTVELVARAGKRGLAVRWGAVRDPLVLGAGVHTPVLQLADEETPGASLAGAHPSQLEDDLSDLQAWSIRQTPLPKFLPPGRGPAIVLSGGDAAWVVYLSPGTDLYYAPLGY